jgi:uncharacterized membrane protein YfcA
MLFDVMTSVFAAIVLWCSVKSATHMNKHTCHVMRVAVIALGAAALGLLLAPLYPQSSEAKYAGVVFVVAVALYMMADRRDRKPEVSTW